MSAKVNTCVISGNGEKDIFAPCQLGNGLFSFQTPHILTSIFLTIKYFTSQFRASAPLWVPDKWKI
jgi:hypothetical protein